MKNKTDKLKWYEVCLFIMLFIVTIPYLVVVSIKNHIAQKGREEVVPSLMCYLEPLNPLPDEEFVSRIDEFVCIQYKTFNGLSGKSYACQLIAEENPERKNTYCLF